MRSSAAWYPAFVPRRVLTTARVAATLLALSLAACTSKSVTKDATGGTGGAAGGSGGASGGAAGSSGGTAGAAGSTGGFAGASGSGSTAVDLVGCGVPSTDQPQPSLYSTLNSDAEMNPSAIGPSGAISGNASFQTGGKCGKSLALTGLQGTFAVWPAAVLDFTKGTIAFWLRPNWDHTDPGLRELIVTDGLGTPGGGMSVTKQDNASLAVRFNTSLPPAEIGKAIDGGSYTLSQGVWTHIVINWDFNDPNDKINIYVSGKKDDAKTLGMVPAINGSGSKIQLGSSASPATAADADFDEIKIYTSRIAPL